MAKERSKSASAKARLPNSGDALLMPLEDGRFGVCRVLREPNEDEGKSYGRRSLLVAASPWLGQKAPELNQRRLREIHVLTHHCHTNAPAVLWVSDPIPATFRLLGTITSMPSEKRMKSPAYGGWEWFAIQVFLQWRWDNDREAVLREDEEKKRLQALEYEKSLKEHEKHLAGLSLQRLRKKRRFLEWKGYVPEKVIAACATVFDKTIDALLKIGPNPKKRTALGILRQCIEKLNDLDEKHGRFIETIAREDLCAELDDIAHASGVQGEENLADRWREW